MIAFLAEPEVAIWQSYEDFGQLVEKCLEADEIQFDIFYGISDNAFHYETVLLLSILMV